MKDRWYVGGFPFNFLKCLKVENFLRSLVTVDQFQLDEPIVAGDYFELMAPESDRFFCILFGNLHRKGLLPVKIEQIEIEEVGFFLDALEFKGDFFEIELFVF